MKKKDLMQKIYDDVWEEMYQCIMADMDRMYFEKDYGNGVVQVDIYEVPAACEIADVQCYVLHFDGKDRHSPRLEAAIIGMLPDWFDLKREIQDRV